jgi:hypothetical protein
LLQPTSDEAIFDDEDKFEICRRIFFPEKPSRNNKDYWRTIPTGEILLDLPRFRDLFATWAGDKDTRPAGIDDDAMRVFEAAIY